jgi:NADH:ubiquinone oxidoreductase subunit 6 (subunit J)
MSILTILLVLAIIGAVVMLIRGIIAFLKNTEADLNGESPGPSASGLQQNKMMQGRVAFQAVAIVIVIIMLAMARG